MWDVGFGKWDVGRGIGDIRLGKWDVGSGDVRWRRYDNVNQSLIL